MDLVVSWDLMDNDITLKLLELDLRTFINVNEMKSELDMT